MNRCSRLSGRRAAGEGLTGRWRATLLPIVRLVCAGVVVGCDLPNGIEETDGVTPKVRIQIPAQPVVVAVDKNLRLQAGLDAPAGTEANKWEWTIGGIGVGEGQSATLSEQTNPGHRMLKVLYRDQDGETEDTVSVYFSRTPDVTLFVPPATGVDSLGPGQWRMLGIDSMGFDVIGVDHAGDLPADTACVVTGPNESISEDPCVSSPTTGRAFVPTGEGQHELIMRVTRADPTRAFAGSLTAADTLGVEVIRAPEVEFADSLYAARGDTLDLTRDSIWSLTNQWRADREIEDLCLSLEAIPAELPVRLSDDSNQEDGEDSCDGNGVTMVSPTPPSLRWEVDTEPGDYWVRLDVVDEFGLDGSLPDPARILVRDRPRPVVREEDRVSLSDPIVGGQTVKIGIELETTADDPRVLDRVLCVALVPASEPSPAPCGEFSGLRATDDPETYEVVADPGSYRLIGTVLDDLGLKGFLIHEPEITVNPLGNPEGGF